MIKPDNARFVGSLWIQEAIGAFDIRSVDIPDGFGIIFRAALGELHHTFSPGIKANIGATFLSIEELHGKRCLD